MTTPEDMPEEESFSEADIAMALAIANSSGAQSVYALLQQHPNLSGVVQAAIQYGARHGRATGPGPDPGEDYPDGQAYQQDAGYPDGSAEDNLADTASLRVTGLRGPASIYPVVGSGRRQAGPAHDADRDYPADADTETGRIGYGEAANEQGFDGTRRTASPGGPRRQTSAPAGSRPGVADERLDDLITRGRSSAVAEHPHRRSRLAIAGAAGAAIVAVVVAVAASRGGGSGSAEAPAQPATIATAVQNPSWLHNPNVLTALRDELIQAAEDPSIAVPVKASGTSQEVPYNAVKDNPDMVRAVATTILYLGGDPYGLRGTQLAGVVPESKKEFTPAVNQVNANRKALGQAPIVTDAFNPPTSLRAALEQANQIAAAETDSELGKPLPADFYATYFTKYCQGLGYSGAGLKAAVGNLQAIFDTWGNQTSPAYDHLSHIKGFQARVTAVLTDQRNYRPGP